MGYNTEFQGEFMLDRALEPEHEKLLEKMRDEDRESQEPWDADESNELKGAPYYNCQWYYDRQGKSIAWDGGEKFYDSVEWLEFLIHNLFKKFGYTLSGQCYWRGEDFLDLGLIIVKDNVVEIVEFREVIQEATSKYVGE